MDELRTMPKPMRTQWAIWMVREIAATMQAAAKKAQTSTKIGEGMIEGK